jgi:hypothetical protein
MQEQQISHARKACSSVKLERQKGKLGSHMHIYKEGRRELNKSVVPSIIGPLQQSTVHAWQGEISLSLSSSPDRWRQQATGSCTVPIAQQPSLPPPHVTPCHSSPALPVVHLCSFDLGIPSALIYSCMLWFVVLCCDFSCDAYALPWMCVVLLSDLCCDFKVWHCLCLPNATLFYCT